MSDDGTREAQGWQGQEGQPQEGPEEQVACTICNRGGDVHDGVNVRHAFTPPGVDVKTSQFGPKRPKGDRRGNDKGARRETPQGAAGGEHRVLPGYDRGPIDGGLRLALINAGVLTMDDLAEADATCAALNGHLTMIVKEAEERGN